MQIRGSGTQDLRGAVCPLIAIMLCACGPIVKRPRFPRHPNTVRAGSPLGPFDGRVIDRSTNRPIEGARVQASWIFERGLGSPTTFRAHSEHVLTDPDGRYLIARLRELPQGLSARLARFVLLVYHEGYVAYRSDRLFASRRQRIDFSQHDNIVRLSPWRPDISHARHLLFAGGDAALRAGMVPERGPAAREVAAGEAAPPGGTRLVDETEALGRADSAEQAPSLGEAGELLSPDDVGAVTGFYGPFKTGALSDAMDATSTVHLRAVGRPESFDVGLRLWRLPPEALEIKFAELMDSLPLSEPVDEPVGRAFVASQDEIRGLCFLDAREGALVLLTCGAKLCRSRDDLLRLGELAAERLEREVDPPPPGELLPLEDSAPSRQDAEGPDPQTQSNPAAEPTQRRPVEPRR